MPGATSSARQQRSLGVPESELIKIAIKTLGLEELAPFNPEERIIEYRLRQGSNARLAGLTVRRFIEETASESTAPGGGSVAALLGSLAAALGTMVANLSAHKPGWDARWEEFSKAAVQGQRLAAQLLELVDEDTRAFTQVMAALGLPKSTPEEKAARSAALVAANRVATEVPYRVMRRVAETLPLIQAMVETGNPASASDAGVGALCARAAIRGAWLNVRTNVAGMKDRSAFQAILAEGERLEREAGQWEGRVLAVVEAKMR